MAAVKNEDNKWGYINEEGEVVIAHKYDSCLPFSEGLAAVCPNYEGYGIDSNPWDYYQLQYIIGECGLTSLGMLGDVCIQTYFNKSVSGDWKFINKSGGDVIACKEYRKVGSFHDGLAPVMDKKGRWGYINWDGEEVIPCKFREASEFREGVATVSNDEGKCGLIDEKGEIILPYKYVFIGPFYEGIATVVDFVDKGSIRSNFYGAINKEGDWIIPCKYSFVRRFSQGVAVVMKEKKKKGGYEYFYIDKEGKEAR